jgi:hypothetical protein
MHHVTVCAGEGVCPGDVGQPPPYMRMCALASPGTSGGCGGWDQTLRVGVIAYVMVWVSHSLGCTCACGARGPFWWLLECIDQHGQSNVCVALLPSPLTR